MAVTRTNEWRELVEASDAPSGRQLEVIDVRRLGPPEPLRRTLETLADATRDTVFMQVNDRAPQHLYPKLDARGIEYRTVETDDATVTLLWVP